MAVGVTLGTRNTADSGWGLGTDEGIFASTANNHPGDQISHVAVYDRNTPDGYGRRLPRLKKKCLKCVVLIELDESNEFMRIDAEGNNGEPSYELRLPLQVKSLNDVDFRPCIVLHGFVTATIIPWSDA